MKQTMQSLILFSTALIFCGHALASDAPKPEKNFTLTIAPLHLLLGIVEVNGEFKANNNLGVALILGTGTYKSTITTDSFSVSEYGFQVSYYPDSNFNDGVQYGLEVMRVDLQLISKSNIKSSGSGVAFGPYIGYKAVLDSNFVFVGQIGFQGYSVTAKAQDSNGNSASAGGAGGGLLLNLNVGYSF